MYEAYVDVNSRRMIDPFRVTGGEKHGDFFESSRVPAEYELFSLEDGTFQFKFNYGSDLLKIPRFWGTGLCPPLRGQ